MTRPVKRKSHTQDGRALLYGSPMSRSLIALGIAVFLGLAAPGPQPTQARSAEQRTQIRLDELRRARELDKRRYRKARELDKRRYRKAKRLLQRQRQKAKALIRRGQNTD